MLNPDPDLIKISIFIILVYLVSFSLFKTLSNKKKQCVPFVIGIIGIIYQLVANRTESFANLGFCLATPEVYLQGFLTICGILFVLLAISYLAGKLHPTKNIDVRKQLISFFLLLISSALVAIFTEELVFRGCIQRQLLKLTSPLSAILIASTIFGIWHIPAGRWLKLSNAQILVYCIGAGLVGVMLGLFYYVSQSLIVTGVLHGLWNGIVYKVWGLGDVAHGLFVSKNDALTHPEYGIMGVSILALAVLLLLIRYL